MHLVFREITLPASSRFRRSVNFRGRRVASRGSCDLGMYDSVPCFSRLSSSAFQDCSQRCESGARRAALSDCGFVAVSFWFAVGFIVWRQKEGIDRRASMLSSVVSMAWG